MRTFFSNRWIGFKNFINFIVKHKLLTALITVGAVAIGLMIPAIVAGTITNMIAVEILSVATGIGLLELGVLTIHVIGVIYMLFVVLIRNQGWIFIKSWILTQSILKIAYDLVLSAIALCVAKYGNKFIKYLIY